MCVRGLGQSHSLAHRVHRDYQLHPGRSGDSSGRRRDEPRYGLEHKSGSLHPGPVQHARPYGGTIPGALQQATTPSTLPAIGDFQHDGVLTLSTNGQLLSFAGYQVPAGSADAFTQGGNAQPVIGTTGQNASSLNTSTVVNSYGPGMQTPTSECPSPTMAVDSGRSVSMRPTARIRTAGWPMSPMGRQRRSKVSPIGRHRYRQRPTLRRHGFQLGWESWSLSDQHW